MGNFSTGTVTGNSNVNNWIGLNGAGILEESPSPYTINDMLFSNGDNQEFILEFSLGLLGTPNDIVFATIPILFNEFILELPLGSLNSPLDQLWDTMEILELLPGPPLSLYAPLDILTEASKTGMPIEEFVLTGGGETSYAFIQ